MRFPIGPPDSVGSRFSNRRAAFAAFDVASTTTIALEKALGISGATVHVRFGTERQVFQMVVKRSSHAGLAALRERFSSLLSLPLPECTEGPAESICRVASIEAPKVPSFRQLISASLGDRAVVPPRERDI